MDPYFQYFQSDIANTPIPEELNNPFDTQTPEICTIAAKELQAYLTKHQDNWIHHFGIETPKEGPIRGKMFGVLVVKNHKKELGYLSAFSGTLAKREEQPLFVPTQFDFAADDYFLDREMAELKDIGIQIDQLTQSGYDLNSKEMHALKAKRRNKSMVLQEKIFNHYSFLNISGDNQAIKDIYLDFHGSAPPGGAGECTAPKLLQYAFENDFQPIAIAEFWWGASPNSEDRKHRHFYPACEKKCRPLLTYMLGLEKRL